MARPKPTEIEGAGSDSFLDVVTNIVGILIILVMVVGERARHIQVGAPKPEPKAELVSAQSESQRLEDDIHRLTKQASDIQAVAGAKLMERNRLSVLVTAIEKDLEEQRQKLDSQARERYDFDRELAEVRRELQQLEVERTVAEEAAKPETVTIENFPTPIGRVVDADEAHIRLAHGRLAVLPYQTLMSQLRGTLRSSINRMGDQIEKVDMLGPVEGFRMRYLIQRHDMPQGSMYELAHVEFLPVTSHLGEPVDQAIEPGSSFRRTLELLSPQRYTITVWTYPDSFGEFLTLKKKLYEMGYAVAARPLPDGMPIGASPNGSKSAAQ